MIDAMWHEDDPATKIKLWITFAHQNPYLIADFTMSVIEKELRTSLAELDDNERDEGINFAKWSSEECRGNYTSDKLDELDRLFHSLMGI